MNSIVVNGEQYGLPPGGTSVEALLAEYVPHAVHGAPTGRALGMAVAVNGAVIPRSAWTQTFVTEGDRVEIVTATPGG